MAESYDVKITPQAKEQMKEICHYITHELLAPTAAFNLLNIFGLMKTVQPFTSSQSSTESETKYSN